eukprot:189382-Chlamydomonas_euryale.AAC.2
MLFCVITAAQLPQRISTGDRMRCGVPDVQGHRTAYPTAQQCPYHRNIKAQSYKGQSALQRGTQIAAEPAPLAWGRIVVRGLRHRLLNQEVCMTDCLIVRYASPVGSSRSTRQPLPDRAVRVPGWLTALCTIAWLCNSRLVQRAVYVTGSPARGWAVRVNLSSRPAIVSPGTCARQYRAVRGRGVEQQACHRQHSSQQYRVVRDGGGGGGGGSTALLSGEGDVEVAKP